MAEQSKTKPASEEPQTAAAEAVSADPASQPEITEDSQRRTAKRRPAGPPRRRVAANDDVPTIGGLIYALQQKPSKKPFAVAAGASAGWLLIGALFTWAMLAPEIASAKSFVELFGRPIILTVAATIFIPIVLFWFLASLIWRAQELRLMSSAMTEVAVRLAEPDREAEQSVASLGQAVRRQVNFMNEAMSRALGRASELETLVHHEVSALERSYGENEKRIRGLLSELAGERDALVGTSDHVANTLRSIGDEVPQLIEKLSSQQTKLAHIIEGAGANLIALDTQLTASTDRLEGSLATRTEHLQTVLTDYTDALGNALGVRTTEMQGLLNDYTTTLTSSLGDRTGQLKTMFDDYTRALDATLASRAEAIDSQLVQRTKALDAAFSQRLQLFDDQIMQSTRVIDSAVGEKAQALSNAMEQHAKQLADTLGRQAGDLDETLMHGINAVRRTSENITRQSVKAIEGLASQSDLLKNVSENLLQQISGVTNRFESQGQSIMRAANALETANFRIDTTLQSRHRDLNDTLGKLSGKAEQLDEVVRNYSTHLEGSLTEAEGRARSFTEELTRGAQTQSQATLAELERMKNETSDRTTRALEDLRNQFGSVSREMTEQLGSLTTRVAESSDDLRTRAQRAAAELEVDQARLAKEAERIPTVTRQSSEAMRKVLQEQLKALEQLSTLSQRQTTQRSITPPLPAPGTATAGPTPLSQMMTQSLQQQDRTRTAAPAAPLAPPVSAARDARWSLGDLLARASLDDEAHGQRSVLSIDSIARALDPATASAIGARLRSGQRGIMVRSIYNAEGRVAFDEMATRYQTNLEFRPAVDRYLAEFEQHLADAELRDPSGRIALSQIASDGGRVYLFLAHASGRLA